jgi:hypothetical protein
MYFIFKNFNYHIVHKGLSCKFFNFCTPVSMSLATSSLKQGDFWKFNVKKDTLCVPADNAALKVFDTSMEYI